MLFAFNISFTMLSKAELANPIAKAGSDSICLSDFIKARAKCKSVNRGI
jgi:hypothetical protein